MPQVPSTQSSSSIVWVSRRGAARWPRNMYRDPLTEVASEAVGFLVLLTPVVVGEFVYFLPTTWKQLPQ